MIHSRRHPITRPNVLIFCLTLAGLSSPLVWAQSGAGDPVDRPGSRRPAVPEFLPPASDGVPALPGQPAAPPSPARGGARFVLEGVQFTGNTVFSTAELQALAEEFVGRAVTIGDVEELRYRLTRKYTDAGYVNSGILVSPGQRISGGRGTVAFSVREGLLETIRVQGTGRLRPQYVGERIWPDKSQPFRIDALQENFERLLRDPLIERMDARLRPGLEPGEGILELDVERGKPYALSLSVDNRRPPSTGAERARLQGTHYNLTGLGDRLDLSLDVSEGANGGEIGYHVPLTANDLTLGLRVVDTESSVIEEPLNDLDIESRFRAYEVNLSQPLIDTRERRFELGVGLEVRQSRGKLLGERFPFSPGDEDDGSSQVTALHFWQDYQYRGADWALAARSTISLGLDLFDPTLHGDSRPDSRFKTWLAQVQFAKAAFGKARLVVRADLQLANDTLLSLERFALGGFGTVRGYRENTLVRDQAAVVGVELRYPLWQNESHAVDLIPFVDFGRAANKGEPGESLFGAGLGVAWRYLDWVDAELFLAHDFNPAPQTSDHNLQDEGAHFRIRVNLL